MVRQCEFLLATCFRNLDTLFRHATCMTPKCAKGFKPTDLRSDAKPVLLYFVLKYQLDHYRIYFTQFQSVQDLWKECLVLLYYDFHCYPYLD